MKPPVRAVQAGAEAADVHPFVTLFSLLLFGGIFGLLGYSRDARGGATDGSPSPVRNTGSTGYRSGSSVARSSSR